LQNPLAPPLHAVFGLTSFKPKTVARKLQISGDDNPADESAEATTNGKMTRAEPKKKSRRPATATKKKKPTTVTKPPTKQRPAVKAQPAGAQSAEPTDEEIRLRAYFLAERRHRLSLPGDSNHDWIEARRQLIEEASR
jgi:hypothetical protein